MTSNKRVMLEALRLPRVLSCWWPRYPFVRLGDTKLTWQQAGDAKREIGAIRRWCTPSQALTVHREEANELTAHWVDATLLFHDQLRGRRDTSLIRPFFRSEDSVSASRPKTPPHVRILKRICRQNPAALGRVQRAQRPARVAFSLSDWSYSVSNRLLAPGPRSQWRI